MRYARVSDGQGPAAYPNTIAGSLDAPSPVVRSAACSARSIIAQTTGAVRAQFVFYKVSYFIFDGNLIVLPATMNIPFPRW